MTKLSEGQLDRNEGFDGLMRIFNSLEINHTDWILTETKKERGGFEFVLPSAEGEIFLNYGDLFNVKVTFVQTKRTFDETCFVGDVEQIIKSLEEQRLKVVGGLRDMLKEAFKAEEE
jgi:hypothetical protein